MLSVLVMTYVKGNNLFFRLLIASVIVMLFGLLREYPSAVKLFQKGGITSRHTGSVSRFVGIQEHDITTIRYATETKKSIGFMRNIVHNNTVFWVGVASLVNSRHLYPAEFRIEDVLHRLATAVVTEAQWFSRDDPDFNFGHTRVGGPVDFGSTHKWLLHLDGGQLAIFKPMWYRRNVSRIHWYDGFELHTSEIAAFHLDRLTTVICSCVVVSVHMAIRILGFRRVPFTVGRRLQLEKEIFSVASSTLRHKFYRRQDGEWCLRDRCYYCEHDVTTCTVNGLLEGAVIYFVAGVAKTADSPWSIRNYYKNATYDMNNQMHCRNLFTHDNHVLLDLVEMAILDYLSYHVDSKYYRIVRGIGTDLMVHLDHGRSFTSYDQDDGISLQPLRQCCRLRHETWSQLKLFDKGTLRYLLKFHLSSDLVSPPPLLADGHFLAIQRRLKHVIAMVDKCLQLNSETNVLIHAV